MGAMRLPVFLLLALLLPTLSGCYLVSDHLVGGAAAMFRDDRLPGLWRQSDKSGYLAITRLKDDSLVFRFFESDFSEDAEFFTVMTTKTGGVTFLNARKHAALTAKPTDAGYIPAHYEFRGDTLAISLFATELFNQAIAEKKLLGNAAVKTGAYGTTPTRMTGSGEDVAKFIVAELYKPGVLEKPVLLTRVALK